jgi:hypothetical protein
MAIPQSQLDIWSHQGSKSQSAATYSTIKSALEHQNAQYADRDFEVFLQGSYGNDTNIFAESDVDIVIRHNNAFCYDLSSLPADQQIAFNADYSNSTYTYSSFKTHVLEALTASFGDSVQPGKKAIKIKAKGARRNADVIVAIGFRWYHEFINIDDQLYDPGIGFYTTDGTQIGNYPKQHSDNCTAKHQATGNNFKPIVRIFKNMRSKLVEDGKMQADVAPSYYIEGLLYNVPSSLYSGRYESMVPNILKWLYQTTDRTNFVCASEQHYLLRDNSHVCWPVANGKTFINAVIELWKHW